MLLEVISPGVMSQQQQEAVYQDPLSSVFQRLPPPSSFPAEGAEWSLGTGDGFAESAGKESIEGAGINLECALAATRVLRHQELLNQGRGISPG